MDLWSTIFEKPFELVVTTPDKVPPSKEATIPLGRHLEGYRIGFDLGASDRKFSAVVDGEPIFGGRCSGTRATRATPPITITRS